MEAKSAVDQEFGFSKNDRGEPTSHLVALIKPTRKSSYKNLIDALDEMEICAVSKHVLLEPTADEMAFIESKN